MIESITKEYLAELVLAGLEERPPRPIPDSLSVEQLAAMAQEMQMVYLLISPLLRLPLPESEQELARRRVLGSMLQTRAQLHAIAEMEQQFEAAGIRHQFLKGAVLKQIYPRPECREMSDIDVMIYGDHVEEAGRLLVANGYVLKESIHNHNVYIKPPFLYVEVHWALYDSTVDAYQANYYRNFDRINPKTGHSHACEFSKEDFYVYMISHIAKHFYERGCGVRNLVDVFWFCKSFPQQIASENVAQEIAACGLTDFERNIRELAFAWLAGGEKRDYFDVFLDYMYQSGVHGRDENGIWNKVSLYIAQDAHKGNQYLRRWYYFPPIAYMREDYPWLEGRRWLLPWAWVMRAVMGAVKHKGGSRLRLLKEISEDEFVAMQRLYKELDLKFSRSSREGASAQADARRGMETDAKLNAAHTKRGP